MRFRFYTNETIDPTRNYFNFDGFVVGAIMQLAYSGLLHPNFTSDNPVQALEQLLYDFNMNFPSDYTDRPMGVGDVIVLIDCGVETAYACAGFGWTKLDSFDPSVRNPAWTTFAEQTKGAQG